MGTLVTPARKRGAMWLTIGLVAVVCAAACSQPRLEHLANDLAHSVPRSGTRAVAGVIAIRLDGVEIKGASRAAAGSSVDAANARLYSGPVAIAQFKVQPGRDRAALFGVGGAPVSVTQGRVVYAKRKTNGPADTRPWVRLELQRLVDVSVPDLNALMANQNSGLLAIVTPQFALGLLRGVLTGSVKQRVGADGQRHLRFNVSIAKSQRELKQSKAVRDDHKRLLKAIGVTGDIFSGSGTLRPDGSLSALQLHLAEKPNKRTKVALRVDLTMEPGVNDSFGVARPARVTTIRIASLAALRGNLIDALSVGKGADPTKLPADVASRLPTTTTEMPK